MQQGFPANLRGDGFVSTPPEPITHACIEAFARKDAGAVRTEWATRTRDARRGTSVMHDAQ